jgi:alpha-galactosidase
MDLIDELASHEKKPTALCPDTPVAVFRNACVSIQYHLTPRGQVQLVMVPRHLESEMVPRRERDVSHPFVNDGGVFCSSGDAGEDNLVHLHIRGDDLPDAFIAGMSMRWSASTRNLRFVCQTVAEAESAQLIETTLQLDERLTCRHRLVLPSDARGCFVSVEVENTGQEPFVLESLTSFNLSRLSPFAPDDMPGRLALHRIRSFWSAEGRWERIPVEDLALERSWAGHSMVSEKFHQTGSMPVRRFFPFIGLEDEEAGVFWGGQVHWHGSWQMELWRRKDPFSLSGGLGDFESAHWAKSLKPGERFTAPLAWAATAAGEVADFGEAIKDQYRYGAYPESESEARLPVIFNEWCASWGNPRHDDVLRKAAILKDLGVGVFVIDDGWAEKPDGAIQFNGDWVLNRERFPEGMQSTARALREMGLTPGIWFEAEVCTRGTKAHELSGMHLERDGKTVQVGTRRFWDFRKESVKAYLREKLIDFLRENELGYLKIDYNDSIGLGVDATQPGDGLGEGLREHLDEVKNFFKEVRQSVPGLTFENCSSGGHRIEPGLVSLTSMCSFSDAHETVDIPIIAANLDRIIPACKNQIWAVLREKDDRQRLLYSLSATFIGRMCLSGDIEQLSSEALEIVGDFIRLYDLCRPLIADGRSRLVRQLGSSYRYPEGAQYLLRTAESSGRAMAVFHRFGGKTPESFEVELPGAGQWRLQQSIFDGSLSVSGNRLKIEFPQNFTGGVALLQNNRH